MKLEFLTQLNSVSHKQTHFLYEMKKISTERFNRPYPTGQQTFHYCLLTQILTDGVQTHASSVYKYI